MVVPKAIKRMLKKYDDSNWKSNLLSEMNVNFYNPPASNTDKVNASTTYTELVRTERKFAISAINKSYALAWLSQNLIPDQNYPIGNIYSVYFDTHTLASYHQSLDGALEKQKVRIRWYPDPLTGQCTKIYVELKSRVGFETIKRRRQIEAPIISLDTYDIMNTIRQLDIQELLLGSGFNFLGPLYPTILIRYNRRRFVSLDYSASISFDSNISSWVLNPKFSTLKGWVELKTSVLELKGSNMELPLGLKNLHNLGTYWTSFSKYALCLESHFDRVGSLGWLEPNFPSKGL